MVQLAITDNQKNISIRLALNNDFDQIYQIWLEGIENSFESGAIEPTILMGRFRENFNNRKGIFNYWVAEQNGIILGWQSLIKNSHNPFREDLYAESSTYISKSCRFKGIGELLIDHVVKAAEKSQLEYIMGYIAVGNLAARRITAKTGWLEIGSIPPSLKNKNGKSKILLIRPV